MPGREHRDATTVQMGIIGYVSWMQPATAIAGLLVLVLGPQLPRRERIAH